MSVRSVWLTGRLLVSLALVAGGVVADHFPDHPATAASVGHSALTLDFERYTLANGLEVILHQDPQLPLVAINLWYHVGPANEPPGRSGFAHLFEHLMFEGSRHVGDRFDVLLEAAGATNVNGTTSWDRTNYFETVPREHLALALWIESDRMAFLLDQLTPEDLATQRSVVLNERRQTYETAPYGPSTLALFDLLFPPEHPYHGVVIGSVEDISAATMADVRSFYSRFYAPSNATLTLAGDIDRTTAKALVAKYFGTLPRRPAPTRARPPTEPLSAASRAVVNEPVELARASMAWIVPPAYGPEDAALEVLSAVLAGGRATELYRDLVVDQRLASEVTAYVDSNQLCGVFVVGATAASHVDATTLERATAKVIERLSQTGPTEAAVHRAKRRILVSLFANLQLLNDSGGESGRAGILQRFNHYLGDPGYLPRYVAALEAVTVADLQRVAARYLAPDRRATVLTHPSPPSPTP